MKQTEQPKNLRRNLWVDGLALLWLVSVLGFYLYRFFSDYLADNLYRIQVLWQ